MNSIKNKIELVKIPVEVDNEDLRIVFESNAFGYQTVVDIKDKLIESSQLKNVLIEFETPEAAKQVAKSASFKFDFGNGEVLLRPVLYIENIVPKNNSKQDKIEDKSFKKDLEQLHTCWIGNIPDKHGAKKLEEFFKKQTETITDQIHSIKLVLNEKHKKYQCFINLYSPSDAQLVVEHFNGSKMENVVLESKLRSQKSGETNANSQSDSDSDSSEFDAESVCGEANKEGKYGKTFRVHRSKHFKSLIKKHMDDFRLKVGDDVSVKENVSRKGNLNFKVVANSEQKLAEIMHQLNTNMKVVRKKIKLSAKEYALVQNLKSELIQIKPNKCKDYLSIYLEDRSNTVVVEFFDSGDKILRREYFKYLNQIEKYWDEKIELEKEILISDSDQFEYFKLYLNNKTDLKYTVQKIGKNFKVNLTGKKIHLDKFGWSELAKQIRVVNFTSEIKNKGIISYMNFKLRRFKSELEKDDIILCYDKIEAGSATYSFRIVSSLDSREVQRKAHEVMSYFEKAKLLVVSFDNASLVKQIEQDIQSMNLTDLDFKYREDKKKFFVNSADENALNLAKLIIESKRQK
ncbi:hypothetical protein BpHYR1_032151 [Brachionus plicatilis]|uniref:RRM domain-containing protein n=1 Tax=Brachionus plicatilis TaxID=10195 RepID=A0A3M7Q9H3_BRAPC|nr:hypothetical protein BpHYR1_032151 [Brachionus plicatilis]